MMCRSIDYQMLVVALLHFRCETLNRVSVITRDLSTTYESVCTMVFPRTVQTADKFHVVMHMSKALQDNRVRLKKEVERQEKKASRDHAVKYKAYTAKPKGERLQMRKMNREPALPNGETRV